MKIKFPIALYLAALFSFPVQSGEQITVNKNKISGEFSEIDNNKKKLYSLNKDYLKRGGENFYILGPGDTLYVRVSREYPELDSIKTINGEGEISLPIIDKIYVEGLTIEELKILLNESYLEEIKFPNLEIEITNYRPIKIIIEGEVSNPGFHTMDGSKKLISTKENNYTSYFDEEFNRARLINRNEFNQQKISAQKILENNAVKPINFYFPTVFDAIRVSGGVTENSNLSEVIIKRKNSISNGGGRITAKLNFEEDLQTGENSQNIRIYDGDVIKVTRTENGKKNNIFSSIKANLSKKYISVYVSGRVNEPGMLVLTRLSTLNDAIDMAGGAKVLKGPVRFVSFNNDGTIDKRKIRYSPNSKRGSYKNPYVKDGDLIIVDNSLLSSSNEVIREFTSPFIGIFSTYGLIKALDD